MRPLYLSQRYGTPTTRRFCRSMAEAFPQDHADPITRYTSETRLWEAIAAVLLAVAIGVGLAAALVAWWSA